jgi:hypothetical protein
MFGRWNDDTCSKRFPSICKFGWTERPCNVSEWSEWGAYNRYLFYY